MPFPYQGMFNWAKSYQSAYLEAKPFPHVIVNDFLPDEMLADAVESFPHPSDGFWRRNDTEHTKAKYTAQTVYGHALLKEMRFPEKAKAVFRELNSGTFLIFLQFLTGIEKLIADPYYVEGGFHMVGNGGKLDIHADFSHHSHLKLERRINLLVYLNDDWKDEYGGCLDLCDEAVRPVQRIVPVKNRAVIFSTSETSYHGHPEPMRLPDGVMRRSIALYYYTMPREERRKHPIIFPRRMEAVAA